jgi:outer membrane protein assembly factor BamB
MRTLLAFILLSTAAIAGHPFLCCDYGGGKVCVVSAEGKIEWQWDCKSPQDCWKLPNGNYLFCFVSGALEVTPDKKIVWEYKAPTEVKNEVHACQPLPDGNVMIVECGTSRIIEVDRAGKIVKEIKLSTTEPKLHNQFRGTRKLANGHYTVCFKGEGRVVELDGDGKEVRSIKVPGDPHEAVTLPDGHLLVTCGDGHKVIEFDADGKSVWELNENDLPGNTLRLMAGCQRLPNGNTVFCVYLGHGHIGEQPQVIEVTRDKKVVWEVADHAQFKTINQIMLLDVPGDVTKGEIHR